MRNRIGFMQGRLCDPVNGKIQAFPWRDWKNEFPLANKASLHLMEWTLDQDSLYENPLLTPKGRHKIHSLCKQYKVSIPSLTGDCFMQAPFWNSGGETRTKLVSDFLEICRASAMVGINIIVVPLVDNGSLKTIAQENDLVYFLLNHSTFFIKNKLRIAFESDYPPPDLARFISRFPAEQFGINYDIGNSASFGFNPVEEFSAFGVRIINVHVKDRLIGGTTVPLKTGSADFNLVFSLLTKQNYRGNFILQTARADKSNHMEVLCDYRDMVQEWMQKTEF